MPKHITVSNSTPEERAISSVLTFDWVNFTVWFRMFGLKDMLSL